MVVVLYCKFGCLVVNYFICHLVVVCVLFSWLVVGIVSVWLVGDWLIVGWW